MNSAHKAIVRRFVKRYGMRKAAQQSGIAPPTIKRVIEGKDTHLASRRMMERWIADLVFAESSMEWDASEGKPSR
jgi:hypothetical protein